jgi:hypothetical protein
VTLIDIPQDAIVLDTGDMMARADWIRAVLNKKLLLVRADRVRLTDAMPEASSTMHLGATV